MYFTKDTEASIIKYNNEDDVEIKSRIFREELYVPFMKLIENNINTYNFVYIENNFSIIQKDVMSFVIQKLNYFDESKGKAAYSYFNKIIKNYLINMNNKCYKRSVSNQSIDDDAENKNVDLDECFSIGENNEELNIFIIDGVIKHIEEHMETMFKKDEERNVAWGVIELLTRHETLPSYKKKDIYRMLKEYSRIEKTSKITQILNKIRVVYPKVRRELVEEYYQRNINR